MKRAHSVTANYILLLFGTIVCLPSEPVVISFVNIVNTQKKFIIIHKVLNWSFRIKSLASGCLIVYPVYRPKV